MLAPDVHKTHYRISISSGQGTEVKGHRSGKGDLKALGCSTAYGNVCTSAAIQEDGTAGVRNQGNRVGVGGARQSGAGQGGA